MRIINHLYARDTMNKSVAEIYKDVNIYFEQVFYILIRSLLINQPLSSIYFDKLLKYNIHSKLTYNSLSSLFAVVMNAFFLHS